MLILPSIELRFISLFVDDTFEPMILISPLPEARFIELLAMRFEEIDCDDSVVEEDFFQNY